MERIFSFIIPVYNRPDELRELLESLGNQTLHNFEVVIIEDGSDILSEALVLQYDKVMEIHYHRSTKIGPSKARNLGMRLSRGDYMLFVDSDCILPPEYLMRINEHLNENEVDAFGGPDRAHPDFNLVQKAISYSMTSFFTTGGIRGGKKQMSFFYPRSYNMGISRKVYESIGGFPDTLMHPGEDMVFSIEVVKRKFVTACFTDVFVYHKRRSTLRGFYRQVFRFGKTRHVISKVYPETFRIFYFFPTLFLAGSFGLIVLSLLFSWMFMFPILLYLLVVFIDALVKSHSLPQSLLSLVTSIIQITAYGAGFFGAWISVEVLRRDEFGVFRRGFYPDQADPKIQL